MLSTSIQSFDYEKLTSSRRVADFVLLLDMLVPAELIARLLNHLKVRHCFV